MIRLNQKTLFPSDKSMVKASYIIAFFMCVLFFIIPKAFAALPNTMAEDIVSGGTKIITDAVQGKKPYGEFLTYATGVKMNEATTEIRPGSYYDEIHKQNSNYGKTAYETDSALLTTFQTFIALLKGFSGFFVVALSIAQIIKEIGNGADGVETILKAFTSMAVTVVIILNMDEIVAALCNIAFEITAGAAFTGESTTDVVTNIPTDANIWEIADAYSKSPTVIEANKLLKEVAGKTSGGAFWWIKGVAGLIIPWVFSKIINIAATFVLLQTAIEIALRRIWLPIAVVDIYQEGMRSPGVKYLKKLIAAILKIACCCLIARIVTETTGIFSSTSGLNYAFTLIAINVTAIGAMFKAGEITNDALGV